MTSARFVHVTWSRAGREPDIAIPGNFIDPEADSDGGFHVLRFPRHSPTQGRCYSRVGKLTRSKVKLKSE